MEENIKILEGYLDRNTQLFEDYGENAIIQDKEIQALENLIKGYRSEKEQNTASRKVIVEQCDYIQNKSIPKSKVKEKIEELEEEKKYYYSDYKIDELNDKIQVLQELMEDK